MSETTVPARDVKERLRLEVRARIASLSEADRRKSDDAICGFLFELARGKDVSFVLGYLALPDEVRIDRFLAEMVASGTPVLVPRVEAGCLQFGSWHPGVKLGRDEKGVLAPETAMVESLPPRDGLIVVPGRAFDTAGRRLGRGGGYYDALLSGITGTFLIAGVAYECQLVETVPSESHDRGVQTIVTEAQIRQLPLASASDAAQ